MVDMNISVSRDKCSIVGRVSHQASHGPDEIPFTFTHFPLLEVPVPQATFQSLVWLGRSLRKGKIHCSCIWLQSLHLTCLRHTGLQHRWEPSPRKQHTFKDLFLRHPLLERLEPWDSHANCESSSDAGRMHSICLTWLSIFQSQIRFACVSTSEWHAHPSGLRRLQYLTTRLYSGLPLQCRPNPLSVEQATHSLVLSWACARMGGWPGAPDCALGNLGSRWEGFLFRISGWERTQRKNVWHKLPAKQDRAARRSRVGGRVRGGQNKVMIQHIFAKSYLFMH